MGSRLHDLGLFLSIALALSVRAAKGTEGTVVTTMGTEIEETIQKDVLPEMTLAHIPGGPKNGFYLIPLAEPEEKGDFFG
jgi:hypothetical protein